MCGETLHCRSCQACRHCWRPDAAPATCHVPSPARWPEPDECAHAQAAQHSPAAANTLCGHASDMHDLPGLTMPPRPGAQVLQLLLQLVLGPDSQLDPALCSPGPGNAIFPLWRHLACPGNAQAIQPLVHWAVLQGPSVSRLLRLLCPALFDRERYVLQGVLARGGSSIVSH